MKIETNEGLWVSSSFTERFGNKDITPAKNVSSFNKLEKYMTDSEIQKELGIQESTLEDVAAFLKNPPEGCDNGYWNIFYVAGCVVLVSWNSDDREWSVNAWDLDDDRWYAGDRAFGCNSPSEALSSSDLSPSDSLTLGLFKKTSEIYKHLENSVEIKVTDGKITIQKENGALKDFIFQNSDPAVVRKIGKMLVAISKLV